MFAGYSKCYISRIEFHINGAHAVLVHSFLGVDEKLFTELTYAMFRFQSARVAHMVFHLL
jgi:hypothetical protein